ncbi:helix-turn-helix domain-containing protein [Curtobacterium sp. L1-20]|uniref:AraC family transcriptional regulator n=1 Tax=Curtobacterium sp. L1-20 TaxID=3138181 RepID=UPI003B517712
MTTRPALIRVDERGTDLTAARATLSEAYAGIAWEADETDLDFSYRYSAAGDAGMTLRAVQFDGRLVGEMPAGPDFVVQWINRGTGVLDAGRDAVHLEHGRPQLWPSTAFEFAFADYDQRLVQVSRTAVDELAADRDLAVGQVLFDHRAVPSDAAMRQWRQTVHLISATTLDRNASPLLQAEMSRLAAVALLDLYPVRAVDLPPVLFAPGNARVREAVEYVHAHAHLPITSTDVAAHVGLSLRGLQSAFARSVGESPNTCLRRVRLERIRDELLVGDPTTASVAEVARRWGFAHAGRFSGAYARQFGEYPSDTLRRRH